MEIVLYNEINEGAAAEVRRQLSGGGPVTVRISSPGGLVHEGLAIYSLLRAHRGRVTVQIDGLAASIASLIAMAGERIEMAQNGLMMIHAPWMPTVGNATELRKSADALDAHQTAMVTAYTRSGASEQDVIGWMAAETWFTADEALEAGLVDAISSPVRAAASFDLSRFDFRNAPANLTEEDPAMDPQNTDPKKPATPAPQASETAVAAERRRAAEIMAACETAKLPSSFASDLIAKGVGIDQARAQIIDAWADQGDTGVIQGHTATVPAYPSVRTGSPTDSIDDFEAAASDALLIKAGMRPKQVHAAAQDVAGMSLKDLAQACVNRSGRTTGRKSDPIRAAMTTSDFPAILEDAIHKSMRQGFENEPASHRQWIGQASVEDFREQVRPLLGSAPELQLVLEGGEYTYGAMDDDAARYVAKKYGKIIKLTWETLVNDNLGAFLRAQPAMGQAAVRRETDVVYDLLKSNPTMQDNKALFHADHANLAASQTQFGATALRAGRLLMRKQTALGGGLMSLVPRVLLVPAELESDAEVLLRASTIHSTSVTESTTVSGEMDGSVTRLDSPTPDWVSRLALSVEPRLPDGAFYLIAAPTQADFIELGAFEGSPSLVEDEGFDSDVIQWKIRHVFGVGALDWRGAVKVPYSPS